MPIPFLASVYFDGWPTYLPSPWKLGAGAGTILTLSVLKRFFSGAMTLSERKMHGCVVLLTGGTSGVGAEVAFELASRGAQLVLLTRMPGSDPFLVDYVDDLRARTGNQLIYTEQVDLTDLLSVRKFATKWIDNAPPRRLDMVILCAATLTPPGGRRRETPEGVEETWMVNYLANFHLLGILSPALKAQPFDRDVRIIFATCSSYIYSPKLGDAHSHAVNFGKDWSPANAYASSKLALMTFAQAFQQHLSSYKRPDQLPMSAKVIMVDPGLARTPGTRRWMTRGSLWGLLVYLITYLVTWMFLKPPLYAAQSILYAAFDSSIVRDPGGKLIKECIEVDCARRDVKDEEVAKKLWESSDKLIEATEKEAAMRKAREKAAREEGEKQEKTEQDTKQKTEEIEALVDAIKKGKAKEQAKEATAKKVKTPKMGGKSGKKAIP
ncbi:unnamed protein product [Discula destructiva]